MGDLRVLFRPAGVTRAAVPPVVPAAVTVLTWVVLLAGTAGCSSPAAPVRAPAAAATRAAAAPSPAADLENAYRTVIKDVLPSVVQIEAGRSLGSGVVFDSRGHVVTNAHVVGGERTFRVTAATGGRPLTARLVSSYPEQDLAVIKVEGSATGLRPATLGDSSKVEVGQIVLAMGSPLGLSSSVTQGIVSATGRTVSESPERGGGATLGNMVQTSAAINPGNSGGALVNLSGEVIGIPTLAAADPGLGSAAPGIGFAIPSSMVRTVAGQIVRHGRVTDSGRAALDIEGRTVLGRNYQPKGVAIVAAESGGAAARAGLRSGDVIKRLGDAPITTITSLLEALAPRKPDERVAVVYDRDDREHTVTVTLGEM
ncbi:trypsin-like peptidase domain-containing protein [Streptomyces sp. LP05-1]|uniref:Trypsin-like peptidase domain-containing protein n=1 Tax=Streptomyces pyxinae TaxID=2970734 RepID=A0ABT2CGU2_9ACTN|nr:trypsin-like peptidase domain-containing protein [Streptomyces sp. LP05-1]MCS0636317.1 trypsin-like peptidase domain-containing protein [Streptomyces sp. LP05-1]